mgnify:CR=1 FL=1
MPLPTILEGLNEHQATDAMKIEMPKMIEDKYLKSLKEKLMKNPEKKHSYMMLGFKYFLHKWVNNEIIIEGIIPWSEFRKNSINAIKILNFINNPFVLAKPYLIHYELF